MHCVTFAFLLMMLTGLFVDGKGAQILVELEDLVEMIDGDDPKNPSKANLSHAMRKAQVLLMKQSIRKKQMAVASVSFDALVIATGENILSEV